MFMYVYMCIHKGQYTIRSVGNFLSAVHQQLNVCSFVLILKSAAASAHISRNSSFFFFSFTALFTNRALHASHGFVHQNLSSLSHSHISGEKTSSSW